MKVRLLFAAVVMSLVAGIASTLAAEACNTAEINRRAFEVFPTIKGKMHQGVGFMLDDRYMLTNAHVVKDSEITLALDTHVVEGKASDSIMKMKVVKTDDKADLALLEVELILNPELYKGPVLDPVKVAKVNTIREYLYGYSSRLTASVSYEVKTKGALPLLEGPSDHGDSGLGLVTCEGELAAVVAGGFNFTDSNGKVRHATVSAGAEAIRAFLEGAWSSLDN